MSFSCSKYSKLNYFSKGSNSIKSVNFVIVHGAVLEEISKSPPILIVPSVEGSNLGSECVNKNAMVAEGDERVDKDHVEIVPYVAACHGSSNDEEDVNHDQVDGIKTKGNNEGPEHALLEEAGFDEREGPND